MLADVSRRARVRFCFRSLLGMWELCFSLLDRLQILRSERTYGKHMKSWKAGELRLFKVDPSIASDSFFLFFQLHPFGFHNSKHSGSLLQAPPSIWHWCSLGFHPWPTLLIPPHVPPGESHSQSWLSLACGQMTVKLSSPAQTSPLLFGSAHPSLVSHFFLGVPQAPQTPQLLDQTSFCPTVSSSVGTLSLLAVPPSLSQSLVSLATADQ